MGRSPEVAVESQYTPPEPSPKTQSPEVFPWEQAPATVIPMAPKRSWDLNADGFWRLSPPWPTVLGLSAVVTLCSALVLIMAAPAKTPALPPVEPRLEKGSAMSLTEPTRSPSLNNSTVNSTPALPSRRPVRPRTPSTSTISAVPTTESPVPPSEPSIMPTSNMAAQIPVDESKVTVYPGLTKADLKEVLKGVGRADPFSKPTVVPVPAQIKLPPPPPLPLTPPLPLEAPPVLGAIAYSPSVGWLAQVQIGDQIYDATKGGRVGTWVVRSVGGTGVVLVKGKQTITLSY